MDFLDRLPREDVADLRREFSTPRIPRCTVCRCPMDGPSRGCPEEHWPDMEEVRCTSTRWPQRGSAL